VGVKEQSHASDTKVTITVARTVGGMNLWIGPEISHTLNVDYDQLMTRTLKCEMTERLSTDSTSQFQCFN